MNEEILKEQLRKMGVTETILTDHELRFFNRSLNVVCDVRPTEELNEETVLKQVKSYVETSFRSNPPPLRLTIHFPFELVQNPDVAEFVLKLSGLYEKNLLSHLMIHSPSSPHEWEPLKVMLKTLHLIYGLGKAKV